MDAIKLSHISKIYKNHVEALKDVSFDVEAGDFFGLIGANGAGKSTLIGIITGLVNRTAGSCSIFGYDLDQYASIIRRMIGVVPQEFNFNVFEKVENILLNYAGYFGIGRSEAKIRAEELMGMLGLLDKRRDDARRLSGGMKRRLMIARALMHRPKLLLLDEPTTGVDVHMRQSTWEYLRDLNSQGTTILLTSHNLDEIEQLCKHAAMIQEGHILKIDSVENLVRSLEKQTYVATLTHTSGIDSIIGYDLNPIDDSTYEVVLQSHDTLTNFISTLHSAGIQVKDIRPKRNRLEQLFLNVKDSG